jgi:hypothetical protein
MAQIQMAQQGKQIRVGAREGYTYHPVKLVVLANGNSPGIRLIPILFITSG